MIKQGVDSSNMPKTRLPWFPIFISEICLAMKRISGRMATSTNKTAAFGVKLIHKCMSKRRYIQKNGQVWCALWAGGIIGPYFFKNDEGHNVTVNGNRYRAMITNFFITELNNHVVQELWFQQDGATCHTARATIDLLKDTFGDRLISRFGPVNWPPRSCDLTPLDYILWGYVKSLVYADSHKRLTIWKTTFAVLLPI
ncbi:uncharacterized protein TNCV_3640951 [Trichonephila clavipes]|nr:uncharacterized protein TNCV_3640951 [Trichonephila clavipes]